MTQHIKRNLSKFVQVKFAITTIRKIPLEGTFVPGMGDFTDFIHVKSVILLKSFFIQEKPLSVECANI